jgi:hypothetical protein
MPEERAPAQQLLEALNETGIPFAEDAWWDEKQNSTQADYGVVEIRSADHLYGDDGLVAQNLRGNVVLYIMDGKDETAGIIQDKLKEVEGLSFALVGKEFLQDILANRWTWRFELLEENLLGE